MPNNSESSEQQLADLKEQCMQDQIDGKEPSDACIKLAEREAERKRKQRLWLKVVVGVLLGISALYVVLHNWMPGSQSNLLTSDNLSVLVKMLEKEDAKLNYDSTGVALALKKELQKDTGLAANPDSLEKELDAKLRLMQFPQIDAGTRQLMLDYVCTQYPPVLECCQTDTAKCDSLCNNCVDNKNLAFDRIVRTMPRADVIESVKLMPVHSKSYFWLNGRLRYWEVILWSIFGVLCSLLYSGTEFMRKDQFRFKEIYVQVAKFFYTPLCAFIIVAGYDYFTADGASTAVVTVESPMGLVVMSFILGFFSGSTIDLLQRLKYVIFPSTATNQDDTEDDDDQKPQQTVVNVNTNSNDNGVGNGSGNGNANPQGGQPVNDLDPDSGQPNGSSQGTAGGSSNNTSESGNASQNNQGQGGSSSSAPANGSSNDSSHEDDIDPTDETGYEPGDENAGLDPRDPNYPR